MYESLVLLFINLLKFGVVLFGVLAFFVIFVTILSNVINRRIALGKRPCDITIFLDDAILASQKRADIILAETTKQMNLKFIYSVLVYKYSFGFVAHCFIQLPISTIFIKESFIKQLDDDELQWIFAHEIGHKECVFEVFTNFAHSLIDQFAAGYFGYETGVKILQKSKYMVFAADNEELEYRIEKLKNRMK